MKYFPCCSFILTETTICSRTIRERTFYEIASELAQSAIEEKVREQFLVSGPCLVGSLTGAVAS